MAVYNGIYIPVSGLFKEVKGTSDQMLNTLETDNANWRHLPYFKYFLLNGENQVYDISIIHKRDSEDLPVNKIASLFLKDKGDIRGDCIIVDNKGNPMTLSIFSRLVSIVKLIPCYNFYPESELHKIFNSTQTLPPKEREDARAPIDKFRRGCRHNNINLDESRRLLNKLEYYLLAQYKYNE